MAARSPLCKARKGGFKDMGGQELLITFFKVSRSSRLARRPNEAAS